MDSLGLQSSARSVAKQRTLGRVAHHGLSEQPRRQAARLFSLERRERRQRRLAVIGSANLDPRSAFLNSEMIAIIDSESLAEELAQAILLDTSPANSWEVDLNDKNQIIWRNDVETVSRQPARNGWQRFQDLFFMLFPKRLY